MFRPAVRTRASLDGAALVLGLLALLASACAHAPVTPGGPAELRFLSSAGEDLPSGPTLDQLAQAPVVCFGERHDSVDDHAAEVALARSLAERSAAFAIGLEMVERPMQPILDAYVAGSIDEREFLERSSWSSRWGFDFGLYRELFELARARRIPLVALNARREVVRRVAQSGAVAARTEFGAEVPELHVDEPDYRAFVTAALDGHEGITPDMLERFVEAQRTWDESMASAAADALVQPPRRGPLLVVAGAFHCAYGLGIPSALAGRGIGPVPVVLGAGVELPEVAARAKADFVVESLSR